MHLNTMREKVNELHNENSQLMDEIYNITSKLYEYEQENQTLRT
jgi:prefoldin subunit 5